MFTVHLVHKKLNMFRFFEQDENAIDVSLIKNRFEIIRTII